MLCILYMMSSMQDEVDSIPHREKAAWLSLLAIGLTLGPYLLWVAIDPPSNDLPNLRVMGWFAGAVAVQVVILAVGHAWFRLRSPEDACSPADERDHAIHRRSISVAYYVLIVGMILVGCVMPFQWSGWKLINTAIFMIVLAELVHYGVAVWCYRRGWHGPA